MSAALINISTGERFELEAVAVIGRSDESTVPIPDPHVSRRHAMIRRQDNGYWFYDLGSFNGSELGGVRVTTASRLENGDMIGIGQEEVRFEMDVNSENFSRGNTSIGSTVAQVYTMDAVVLVSDLRNFSGTGRKAPPSATRWVRSASRVAATRWKFSLSTTSPCLRRETLRPSRRIFEANQCRDL